MAAESDRSAADRKRTEALVQKNQKKYGKNCVWKGGLLAGNEQNADGLQILLLLSYNSAS